ncbi:MAG TPA: S8 family peptidase [Solirubrobacteraceae bacterium]|nr:S8 family peptidase [Solirubrobacteraceae bacterium]
MPFTLRRPGRLPLAAPALALCLLAALVLAGVPAAPTPGSSSAGATAVVAPPANVGQSLLAAAERTPARQVEVIVQLRRETAAPAATAAIERAGGRVTRRLPLVKGVVASLPAAAAADLGRRADVRAVSLNAAVESSGAVDPTALRTSFNQSIRAERAWGMGTTGKGIGVAVVDTGIAGDHPDFRVSQADRSSRVIATAVTNPAATNARDTYGHGTHIAGLIAGNGTNRDAGDPLFGRYAGVAPDANLISVKVDDGQGATTLADVIAGLQFVVDFRSEYNIRVVNLSLRSSVAESYRTDPLDAAVEQAWFAGIVVVAAAGNGGATAGSVGYSPGNDPHVITVGAVDDMATKDVADDRLTTWSSRGVTQDGFEKPDVVAPGARIVSTLSPGSYYATQCPACVVDGEYLRIGGTSMSTAMVSGEVADLLQAYPSWTPQQVKATLVKRTRAITSPTSDTLVDAEGRPVTVDSVTATIPHAEAAVDKAYLNPTPAPTSEPAISTLLDGSTRLLDWQRISWSRISWSQAPDALRASFSRVSWSIAQWNRVSWSATQASCAELERVSWSRVSWSDADMASAKLECLAISPSGSWSSAAPVETTRVSWSTSFDR